MKRTIWRPLVLGVVLGLLAGIGISAGLSILTTGETENAIGFYFALLLLSAALGGPVAAVISVTLFLSISYFFGPENVQSVLSDPVVFWSNFIVLALLLILISLGYRLIFERLRMPVRLLPWAGIIIAFYVINPLLIISIQFSLNGEEGLLSALLYTYKSYVGQVSFDIVTTSLIFIALPGSFTRPLWYESKATNNVQAGEL